MTTTTTMMIMICCPSFSSWGGRYLGIVDSQGHSHGKSKLEELSAGRYSAKRKMGGGVRGR